MSYITIIIQRDLNMPFSSSVNRAASSIGGELVKFQSQRTFYFAETWTEVAVRAVGDEVLSRLLMPYSDWSYVMRMRNNLWSLDFVQQPPTIRILEDRADRLAGVIKDIRNAADEIIRFFDAWDADGQKPEPSYELNVTSQEIAKRVIELVIARRPRLRAKYDRNNSAWSISAWSITVWRGPETTGDTVYNVLDLFRRRAITQLEAQRQINQLYNLYGTNPPARRSSGESSLSLVIQRAKRKLLRELK
jgi:hypothetical protein